MRNWIKKSEIERLAKEPAVYDDVKEEYMPEYMLPTFMATEAEAAELSTIVTDISTHVEQSRVKFITGEWNFEKDWTNYVQQLIVSVLNAYWRSVGNNLNALIKTNLRANKQ